MKILPTSTVILVTAGIIWAMISAFLMFSGWFSYPWGYPLSASLAFGVTLTLVGLIIQWLANLESKYNIRLQKGTKVMILLAYFFMSVAVNLSTFYSSLPELIASFMHKITVVCLFLFFALVVQYVIRDCSNPKRVKATNSEGCETEKEG